MFFPSVNRFIAIALELVLDAQVNTQTFYNDWFWTSKLYEPQANYHQFTIIPKFTSKYMDQLSWEILVYKRNGLRYLTEVEKYLPCLFITTIQYEQL
jgi:hypothetical protein